MKVGQVVFGQNRRVTVLTIRAAAPADLEELAELAAETFPLACPPGASERDIAAYLAAELTPERFAAHLADPARAVLLAADEDGRLIGWSMLVGGEPGDADAAAAVAARPTIELSKFYTHAAAHGRGVAAELMTASLEVAAAGGAASVWLGVNAENARAIRFYEKQGFARVGTKRFRLGGRLEHDLVLERAFDAPAGA